MPGGRRGVAPDLLGFETMEAEQAGLGEWLQALQGEGVALHEIAVFARTRRRLEELALPALRAAKVEHQALDADEIPVPDRVVCGTFHGAKGLEFRAVAVIGCDRDQVPLQTVVRRLRDRAEREEFIEHERHLLYVACTRARDRLRVSWTGKACEWLGAALEGERVAAE